MINTKMRAAAIAIGSGQEIDAVASQLEIPVDKLKRWMKQDDFMLLMEEASSAYIRAAVPSAHQVLIKQLKDSNGWLAQAAAREVLHQAQIAAGQASATVSVRFEGMPEPGMPKEE